MSKSAKRYLTMVSDSMSERGPKNETLAEHRKHCKAEKGECPFEQRADESDAQVDDGSRRSLVTTEEDAAYADAVNRGDRETALRMIRESAAKAMPDTKVVDKDGLPKVVWHSGTFGNIGNTIAKGVVHFGSLKAADNRKMVKFREEEFPTISATKESDGWHYWYGDEWMDKHHAYATEKEAEKAGEENYISENPDLAKKYLESESRPYFLNITNYGSVIEDINYGWEDLGREYKARGRDGIAYKNLYEDDGGISYATFDPSQIKSADISYDDNGNLIPLSKRFNPASADIRDEATGKVRRYLVDAQDTTLKEHDDQYHPDGYDPKTMTCEFRERRAKLDPVDGDVKSGGIKGIFTGSAASYSRPSLIHVGTGEGSQVYGWGLYGSSVRGVAETYANAQKADDDGLLFDGKPFTQNINRYGPFANAKERAMAAVLATNGDLKRARENLEANSFNLFGGINPAGKEALTWFDNNKDRFGEKKSIVYEQSFFTDRDEGDESHLLNWYEPVSDENLKRIIDTFTSETGYEVLKIGKNQNGKEYYIIGNDHNDLSAGDGNIYLAKEEIGRDVYEELARAYGSPKSASEFLSRADIDGIKYPVDSYGGKDVKDGDKVGWNYVSFRDDNIRMDKIYENGEERPVRDDATGKIRGYLELAQDDSPTAKGANSLP